MTVQQKFEIVIGSLILSLTMIFLSTTNISIARAEIASDFTSDVRNGLHTGAQNSAIAIIKTQDYKTSWDEFGTNVLVDGAGAPIEIEKSLNDDIVSSLQTELAYNQKDEQYLRLRQFSPEEIIALEGDGGGDLLPQDYIDPNPSLDANPDVNPSALDMPASVVDTSNSPLTPDAGTTPDTGESILPDNLVPPEGEWKPADITVFETILNAEPPAPIDVPSETPADTVPSATPDTIPNAMPPADAPSL